jgi:hypothetical protein
VLADEVELEKLTADARAVRGPADPVGGSHDE